MEPPATSHPPGSDLNWNQSRISAAAAIKKEIFARPRTSGELFFNQDSFKEPPDFWGLQMLVSVKVQPPSEAGTITFPTFAL